MAAVAASVQLARGDGWAVRRPDGLLWTPSDERPDGLIDAFTRAADAIAATAAVTSAVVDAAFDTVPFAVVTWSHGLHVVVLGDVEVCTDAPSLPMLSGRHSRTWVEHRPAVAAATVTVGAPADDGTLLEGGIVRAGGFRLALGVPAAVPASAPPPAPVPVAAPPTPARAAPSVAPADGVSLLRSVTGGDWMEDSIGITGPALITAETTISPDDLLPGSLVAEERAERPAFRRPGGTIVIDGGAAAVFDDVAVIGRTPDVEAAGVAEGAVLCPVTANPAVSRTHLLGARRGRRRHGHRLRFAVGLGARAGRSRGRGDGAVDAVHGHHVGPRPPRRDDHRARRVLRPVGTRPRRRNGVPSLACEAWPIGSSSTWAGCSG